MSYKKNNRVFFRDWGFISYKEALDKQFLLFNKIIEEKIANRSLTKEEQTLTENYLVFCEHPHVFTLGKSGSKEHLLISQQELVEKEAVFFEVGRGGDITYHGPGQLIGYPILDLDNFFTDIHKYMRGLEESVIRLLSDYGLEGKRVPSFTGVWLENKDHSQARKICAFGVKLSRWVSMHGLSLNVNTNLNYFSNIVPCGISNKEVTSMEKELGYPIDMGEVKSKLLKHMSEVFEMEIIKE